MHDDVTRPKGSMVVAVTLKSKMDASSASSARAATRWPSHIRTHVSITAIQIFRFEEIRRHTGFMRDYNYHNARSSFKSIVLRHYA